VTAADALAGSGTWHRNKPPVHETYTSYLWFDMLTGTLVLMVGRCLASDSLSGDDTTHPTGTSCKTISLVVITERCVEPLGLQASSQASCTPSRYTSTVLQNLAVAIRLAHCMPACPYAVPSTRSFSYFLRSDYLLVSAAGH
jgi:hypothetical protein